MGIRRRCMRESEPYSTPGTAAVVKVPRALGEKASKKLEEFEVFGPKALAGIGSLPDTVADRSIPMRLIRRAPHEGVERFRYREASREAMPLRASLLRWALGCIAELRGALPDIPASLNDRAADGWEPLLAIADAAGGTWPQRAREAAVALHSDPWVQEETLGLTLLRAIREIFTQQGLKKISTEKLISELTKRDNEPWGEWWGHAVSGGDTRGSGYRLARLLKPFGIAPRTVKIGEMARRGFLRTDFEDAFSRYLPPESIN